MADTPHDKPAKNVDGNHEDLTRRVTEGAAAQLSDQVLTSQIADAQKKAGADTRVTSNDIIYQADAGSDKFPPKSPTEFVQFAKTYQALPTEHQDQFKDAVAFHMERNQNPHHAKLNNEIMTAMTA